MSDTSANLAMPFLLPSQAQKHVTHNAALDLLDAVVQLSVESRALSVPPALPDDGARYLVAAGATGDWDGQAGQVAVARGGGWAFVAPQPGWLLHDRDTGEVLVFDGTSWARPVPDTDNLAGVGINTGSDLVNRLAVSAPATLLSHDGAGHQLKINKAASGETASLLYQTGWSGRAEIGLAGSDDLALKVSPDGSAWTEALRTEAASGRVIVPQGAEIGGPVTGAAVQSGPLDGSAGVLLRAGAFGLGQAGSGPAAPNDDADACLAAGLGYALSATGTHAPQATPQGGALWVARGGDDELHQVFTGRDGGGLWFRSSQGGALSDWRAVYGSHNLLGAVGQSGGTPTGAVIERGGNANGEYVRFADGTQICTVKLSYTDIQSALGALFGSGLVQWTFPASFLLGARPVVSVDTNSTGNWGSAAVPAVTYANLRAFSFQSEPGGGDLYALALGRWF